MNFFVYVLGGCVLLSSSSGCTVQHVLLSLLPRQSLVLTTCRLWQVVAGSKLGRISAPVMDCGSATSTCQGASGKVCLIQRDKKITFCQMVRNCVLGGSSSRFMEQKRLQPDHASRCWGQNSKVSLVRQVLILLRGVFLHCSCHT